MFRKSVLSVNKNLCPNGVGDRDVGLVWRLGRGLGLAGPHAQTDQEPCHTNVMNNFFNSNEIVSYKDIDDLANKIRFYKKNDKLFRIRYT